jgi:hypothetical protein
MKSISLVFLALLLSGCLGAKFISQNRSNIALLSVGISKEDVHRIMGQKISRYYSNPYSSNMFISNGKTVEVLKYWTDGDRGDGIQEGELTPVILVNGIVVGWGRDFWSQFQHSN